jgi:hypothetical protein
MTTTAPSPGQRRDYTDRLLALGNLLGACPNLPLPAFPDVCVHDGDDADKQAMLDALTVMLIDAGFEVERTVDGNHHAIAAKIGTTTIYRAFAVMAAELQQYRALVSYAGAVTP